MCLVRPRWIDPHHTPIRRRAIRLHEQVTADVVDDDERVVLDRGNEGLESRRPRRCGSCLGLQIGNIQRVAILALAAIGHRENRETFVLGRLQRVKALRILRILEHQHIV